MFKEERYSQILFSYIKFKEMYNEMKTSGKYSQAYLNEIAEEHRQGIKQDLSEFYSIKLQELEQKRDAVKEKYAIKYDNPQEELLRRQDIERNIKVMGDFALKDEVYKLNEIKDPFYFDVLQLELKSRGFENEASKVTGYREAYKINTPWELDEEYQESYKEQALVEQVKNSSYMWHGTGEDRVFYDVSKL